MTKEPSVYIKISTSFGPGEIARLDLVYNCMECLQPYHPTQDEVEANYRKTLCSGSCAASRYGVW